MAATLDDNLPEGQDEKSRRVIRPVFVGEMEYKGYLYLELDALCLTRGEKRRFNVNRILEISKKSNPGLPRCYKLTLIR